MIATAGVAVAIYFAFIIISNYQEVGEAVSNLEWTWVVAAIMLSLAAYLVRALRWIYYLDRLEVDIETREGLKLYFAGLSMLITPAMISGVVKVGLVKAQMGVELKRTLPIVVVERLTDLVGMLVLAAAGVIFFGLGYVSMTGTILFLVVVLAMVRVTPIREAILGLWGRIPGARSHVETFRQLIESAHTLLDRHAFGIGSVYSLVSWGLVGLTLYLLVLGFDMDLTLFESLFIFAFPAILGIMSQTPGGLGVEEMGMETLLLMKDVELPQATALVLVFRLVTLWLGLGVGLVILSGFSQELTTDIEDGDRGTEGVSGGDGG